MSSATYKYIAAVVIGILVGYLFGVSTASKNDDMDIKDADDKEVMETTDTKSDQMTDGFDDAIPFVQSDVFVGNINSNGINPGVIVVSDQPAKDTVHIDRITLAQDSWIAIHEYKDGNLSSYIIGAHRRPAGVHENLDLWINRVMTPGAKYIVAIHQDDGREGFDYHFDTPRLNNEGKVVVATFTAL